MATCGNRREVFFYVIKMLSACTAEIDFWETAVEEILEQLDVGKNLLKNSVGIVSCHFEFISAGTVEKLCMRLPFEVVGCTTLGSAARGLCGQETLGVTVLTSDDVEFSTSVSEAISQNNIHESIASAYNAAKSGLDGEPSFILAFGPYMETVGGSQILDQINRECEGAPVFGTLSCSHSLTHSESHTIRNGGATKDTLAFILMRGGVNPSFHITAIADGNIQKQKSEITDSDGCLLKQVDGMPLLDYFASRGISKNVVLETPTSIPLMVDYGDGTKPVARGMYCITPEGYAQCGGTTPKGAKLTIGKQDYSGILETAEITINKAMENKGGGLLMFPCLSRNLMLGPNSEDEMRKVMGMIGDGTPYHICYSGGEMCPVSDADGKLHNRFHNFTYTVCVLS
jgi:hypothetical protein